MNNTDKNFVRNAALTLRKAGVDNHLIAKALNVSTGTIAAWLANDTRGTYAK